MPWIVYASVVVVGATAFNVLIKLTDGKISPIMGTVILQAAALGVILLIAADQKLRVGETFSMTREGVMYSSLAGISIALANWAIYLMFHAAAPLGISRAIISTAGIILSVLVGLIWFSEHISLAKGTGIVLGIASIYLLLKK